MSKEIYISFDIETDGPIPGPHSMLALGAVAMVKDGRWREAGSFYTNLETLQDAKPHKETQEWWLKQTPEIYQAARSNPKPVVDAMHQFCNWVETMRSRWNATPVAVAYPAGFDFMFLYWYLMKFYGRSPFSFSCIDVKTLAMAALQSPFKYAQKRNFPKEWFREDLDHTHNALDDAREQAWMFTSILNEVRVQQ